MYSLESEKLSIFRIYVIGKISVLLPIVIITSDTGIRIELKKHKTCVIENPRQRFNKIRWQEFFPQKFRIGHK